MLVCVLVLVVVLVEKLVDVIVVLVVVLVGLLVVKIDFKCGDDGVGCLIVQFDGQGVIFDLCMQGNSVVVDVGNV